jgi:hypothetical protein
MKTDEHYKVPNLVYHADQSKRRQAFGNWIDRTKLLFSTIKETRDVLQDITKIRRPTTAHADIALFRYILSKTTQFVQTSLIDLQRRTLKESGYEGLRLIELMFADPDDGPYRRKCMNDFRAIDWQSNDSVSIFNQRFLRTYRTLLSSHQDISESEQIDIYLDALQHHKDPSILYEVKAFRAKVKRGEPISLLETITVTPDDSQWKKKQSAKRSRLGGERWYDGNNSFPSGFARG